MTSKLHPFESPLARFRHIFDVFASDAVQTKTIFFSPESALEPWAQTETQPIARLLASAKEGNKKWIGLLVPNLADPRGPVYAGNQSSGKAIFSACAAQLDQGGTLVAAFDNLSEAKGLKNPRRLLAHLSGRRSNGHLCSADGLNQLAIANGFREVSTYLIYPSLANPFSLVPTHRHLSDYYFASLYRQTPLTRTGLRAWVLTLALRFGVYGRLQRHVLLVATKA